MLAAAGLAFAALSLLQGQFQRGQQTFEKLVAEGEVVEDRLLAHLERITDKHG